MKSTEKILEIIRKRPEISDFGNNYSIDFKRFSRDYLDYYDKVNNQLLETVKKIPKNIRSTDIDHENQKCAVGWVTGFCECGKIYSKKVLCGKEWCPECGQKDSVIHQRRVARWFDKIISTDELGHMVVTTPREVRHLMLDQNILRAFRQYVKRYLQRMGEKKGAIRYHWAGDCKYCQGEGCEDCKFTGSKRKFYPHLHIMHGMGYIHPEKLKKMKVDLKNWMQNRFNIKLKYNVVVYNSFTRDDAQKIFWLKYNTRATWRHYDKKVISVIKGFRTSTTFGKWEIDLELVKKREEEEGSKIMDVNKLEKGNCICCNKPLKWERLQTKREFFDNGFYLGKKIDAGYYHCNHLDVQYINNKNKSP